MNTLLKNLNLQKLILIQKLTKIEETALIMFYNPNANLIADHLHYINKGINLFSSKYDNFIVLGDLSSEISNSFLEKLCGSYNL